MAKILIVRIVPQKNIVEISIHHCTASFITTANSYRHFEKAEKTLKGGDKHSEILNQTYFY